MSNYRCTVLTLALILSAGCVSAAVVAPVLFPQAEAVSAGEIVSVETVPSPYYELRAEGGEVCVFAGDELIMHTGVAVSSLPASDRSLLDGGIAADSPEELTRLLEDLTS